METDDADQFVRLLRKAPEISVFCYFEVKTTDDLTNLLSAAPPPSPSRRGSSVACGTSSLFSMGQTDLVLQRHYAMS